MGISRPPSGYRTFLFTLFHEFVHHLDRTLFSLTRRVVSSKSMSLVENPDGLLGDSPHTRAFYERCWDIFYAILGEPRKPFQWIEIEDGKFRAVL